MIPRRVRSALTILRDRVLDARAALQDRARTRHPRATALNSWAPILPASPHREPLDFSTVTHREDTDLLRRAASEASCIVSDPSDALARSIAARGGIAWVSSPAAGELSALARLQRLDALPQCGFALGPVPAAERPAGRVLVASHDTKFLSSYIASRDIAVDRWTGHNIHDHATSIRMLRSADTIWCEWGLGNAVWYSRHKRRNQRLIVRVHLQELRTPFLRRINHDAVDVYVFVAEHIRETAILCHGVPRDKTVVIPNFVDCQRFSAPKQPGAEHTIALVGPVPQIKRLDLALDIIDQLRYDGFQLLIKGKRPSELPWIAESEFFNAQLARISRMSDCVTWEGFGDDLPQFYSRVGHVLSVSDRESFHYSVAEGAASGAVPYLQDWQGADLLYPRPWLFSSIDEIVGAIRAGGRYPEPEYIARHFDTSVVFPLFDRVIGF